MKQGQACPLGETWVSLAGSILAIGLAVCFSQKMLKYEGTPGGLVGVAQERLE
jgi:hypothetical protein